MTQKAVKPQINTFPEIFVPSNAESLTGLTVVFRNREKLQ